MTSVVDAPLNHNKQQRVSKQQVKLRLVGLRDEGTRLCSIGGAGGRCLLLWELPLCLILQQLDGVRHGFGLLKQNKRYCKHMIKCGMCWNEQGLKGWPARRRRARRAAIPMRLLSFFFYDALERLRSRACVRGAARSPTPTTFTTLNPSSLSLQKPSSSLG